MKILKIWISRAGLEVLGDPSGAKMAQDASWISSGAEFGDVKMAQVAQKWRQDAAMLANLEPKMVNLAPFWEHLRLFFGS